MDAQLAAKATAFRKHISRRQWGVPAGLEKDADLIEFKLKVLQRFAQADASKKESSTSNERPSVAVECNC